jgi:hypothetical protein
MWVCENDDAARVFQMEHVEPTDEVVLVSQANARLALGQQQQTRIFDSAGRKNVYAIGKDANIELSRGSAIVAGVKTQRIGVQVNAQIPCFAQFGRIFRTKSRSRALLQNLANEMRALERLGNIARCDALIGKGITIRTEFEDRLCAPIPRLQI